MASKTPRVPAHPAINRGLAALIGTMAVVLGPAGVPAAFEFAQGPVYDDGQYQEPQDDVPEAEQPGQRDTSPSEDGTDEAPDTTAPEPPSGCNFRDGRPLELLV
jgi:hypothetical protein